MGRISGLIKKLEDEAVDSTRKVFRYSIKNLSGDQLDKHITTYMERLERLNESFMQEPKTRKDLSSLDEERSKVERIVLRFSHGKIFYARDLAEKLGINPRSVARYLTHNKEGWGIKGERVEGHSDYEWTKK